MWQYSFIKSFPLIQWKFTHGPSETIGYHRDLPWVEQTFYCYCASFFFHFSSSPDLASRARHSTAAVVGHLRCFSPFRKSIKLHFHTQPDFPTPGYRFHAWSPTSSRLEKAVTRLGVIYLWVSCPIYFCHLRGLLKLTLSARIRQPIPSATTLAYVWRSCRVQLGKKVGVIVEMKHEEKLAICFFVVSWYDP